MWLGLAGCTTTTCHLDLSPQGQHPTPYMRLFHCSVTPQALAERLRGASAPLIIDVRPRREFEFAHLTGMCPRHYSCELEGVHALWASLVACCFTCAGLAFRCIHNVRVVLLFHPPAALSTNIELMFVTDCSDFEGLQADRSVISFHVLCAFTYSCLCCAFTFVTQSWLDKFLSRLCG